MSEILVQMTDRGVITLPKKLREAYRLQGGATLSLHDLGGVFVLTPHRAEIDALADQVATQWEADGQTLEGMLQTLREERERR
ncbi:MAG: AbrB/MazE/SpoVT family DNA-binding domain-containing protein, partial [Anaerolineae bacterium]|nr:AbrB/MazE/SpoVT family DNA-binding domain-containing protein [Anaerolineae bacterium]